VGASRVRAASDGRFASLSLGRPSRRMCRTPTRVAHSPVPLGRPPGHLLLVLRGAEEAYQVGQCAASTHPVAPVPLPRRPRCVARDSEASRARCASRSSHAMQAPVYARPGHGQPQDVSVERHAREARAGCLNGVIGR
jgi:hypothetical protein